LAGSYPTQQGPMALQVPTQVYPPSSSAVVFTVPWFFFRQRVPVFTSAKRVHIQNTE